MKALILNSGLGTRMGSLTSERPKGMMVIGPNETILSRQLKMLERIGVTEIIMTTGFQHGLLEDYSRSLNSNLFFTFVLNKDYAQTNYIYSIFLAKKYLQDDILMLHGDLVFEFGVLEGITECKNSCMAVSTTLPLPSKDFKAVIVDGKIRKVGVEFFEDAYAAQPLYKLNKRDWVVWLDEIVSYCERGQVHSYAEDALNEVTNLIDISPFDFGERLCVEIDNVDDLKVVRDKVILYDKN